MRRKEAPDGYGSNPTGQAWGCRCTCHEVSTFAQIFPDLNGMSTNQLQRKFQHSTREWARLQREEPSSSVFSNFSTTDLEGCLTVTGSMVLSGGVLGY